MRDSSLPHGDARWRWAGRSVVVAAVVLAVVGARPFAGGWNDGSRLAAVESLAERGTFVIDDSVFVRVHPVENGRPAPYPLDRPDLLEHGTLDKLRIGGHFYSDKSPVPSVLMAGQYRVWLAFGGPTAAERPDLFCWFLTVATSGLAYIVAVECTRRLGRALGLADRIAFLLTLAFAAATVASAYTRHTNAHALFLAAAAGLCLNLAKATESSRRRWIVIGTLAGFGYTLDLGIGPTLLLVLVPACVAFYRRAMPAALVILAAAPWVVAHHALNYAVGGTLAPANSVAEYLSWPGSPFSEENMTGGLKHSPLDFVLYAADMLVGKKGFLFHNPPLLLAPGAAILLAWKRPETRTAVAFAVGWPALGWLLYAATSTNLSGEACSIRWFVPLLAPGFWLLGLLLREFPTYRVDFSWLTVVGVPMAVLMWLDGPWARHMVPGYWGFVAVMLIGWGLVRWRAVTKRSSSAA